jgi:glyoxylase-like metal-dependent hydrolase (beta-lactamase superfamily II)
VPAVHATQSGETIGGLWRFEALHPEWTEEEGGEEGWEPSVGWWALRSRQGLVLIDPLVVDWDELDRLVEASGGCAGVIRTCHWHERSIGAVVERYRAEVWAKRHPDTRAPLRLDHAVGAGAEVFDAAVQVLDVERTDEIALWLPEQRALVFGDAMLRRRDGRLRVCPESWTQPAGGPERLRALLRALGELPVEHVLVSHGPLVLGDGLLSLRRATA